MLRFGMDAKDRTIAKLQAEIADLKAQIKAALQKIAALEKNSQVSHKPLSTDIVKPPKTKQKKKRNIGAQKGRKRNLRKSFPPEEVDTFVTLQCEFEHRPKCNNNLTPSAEPPIVTQQIEIPTKLIHVTEFRQDACFCEYCQASRTTFIRCTKNSAKTRRPCFSFAGLI